MSHDLFHPTDLKPLGTDILHTPFLSEDICEIILECLKEKNTWFYEAKNPHHTDDIHFKKDLPEWYAILEEGLLAVLVPATKYWDISSADIEIINMFAVRYTLSEKTELAKHHDDSYITCSLKLNSNYEGGELFFPRQKTTNKQANVGDLLIWPGQITHPHSSLPLVSGEKYSITVWTKNESLKNHR